MVERTVLRDETCENFLSPGTVHMDGWKNCPQRWNETCENFLSPGTVHRDGCKNCPQRCLLILLFYVFDQWYIKMNYAITI